MIEQSILLHVQRSIYYTSSRGQSICNLILILYPIILELDALILFKHRQGISNRKAVLMLFWSTKRRLVLASQWISIRSNPAITTVSCTGTGQSGDPSWSVITSCQRDHLYLHAIESSAKSKVYDMINKISFKFIDNSAAKICVVPPIQKMTHSISKFLLAAMKFTEESKDVSIIQKHFRNAFHQSQFPNKYIISTHLLKTQKEKLLEHNWLLNRNNGAKCKYAKSLCKCDKNLFSYDIDTQIIELIKGGG